ncbi:MAG: glycerol-3-phosphate 1-O-acyltransferase PlsY [Rickettsiales bacterium]|nr:glycerol-3-phosphate 1-O-acyltransferase PlsY [Rickettsiales bacterium]
MNPLEVIIFAIIGYLLGSIPFGLILTKMTTGEDIRKTGSGNIGATNVLRSGKKGLAIATLLMDAAKAWLAVFIAMQFLAMRVEPSLNEFYPSIAAFAAGFGALIGHMYPVWLKLKGGKGVACYFGMLLGLSPIVFFIAGSIWLLMFAVKRISSLAALITISFIPGWMFVFADAIGAIFLLVASLLVAWRHRENFARLRKGEEKPFGSK